MSLDCSERLASALSDLRVREAMIKSQLDGLGLAARDPEGERINDIGIAIVDGSERCLVARAQARHHLLFIAHIEWGMIECHLFSSLTAEVVNHFSRVREPPLAWCLGSDQG